MALSFEWDEVKAAANEQKHGVSFDEATTVFGDLDARRSLMLNTQSTKIDLSQ
jgi:uncharacterized DUF497 family protein